MDHVALEPRTHIWGFAEAKEALEGRKLLVNITLVGLLAITGVAAVVCIATYKAVLLPSVALIVIPIVAIWLAIAVILPRLEQFEKVREKLAMQGCSLLSQTTLCMEHLIQKMAEEGFRADNIHNVLQEFEDFDFDHSFMLPKDSHRLNEIVINDEHLRENQVQTLLMAAFQKGVIVHLKSLCSYNSWTTNQQLVEKWSQEVLDKGQVSEVGRSAIISAKFVDNLLRSGFWNEEYIERINLQLDALAFKVIADKQRIKPTISLEDNSTIVLRSVFGEAGDIEHILLCFTLRSSTKVTVLGDGFKISYGKKKAISSEDLESKYESYQHQLRNVYNFSFKFGTPEGLENDLFQTQS